MNRGGETSEQDGCEFQGLEFDCFSGTYESKGFRANFLVAFDKGKDEVLKAGQIGELPHTNDNFCVVACQTHLPSSRVFCLGT